MLSPSGLYHSLAKAILSPEKRRACPLAATALPQPPPVAGLACLQALLSQPLPLRGARAARGLVLLPRPPAPFTYTSAWFSQASRSHRMAPEGSVVSHLHLKGSTVTTGWTLADTAHQARRGMNPATCCFCSFLSSHGTFSAEALRRLGLSQPAGCFTKDHLPPSPGKSTAGTSRKNVPVDMYIPQCCNFVCSNCVNTCMDFIIYILYINL